LYSDVSLQKLVNYEFYEKWFSLSTSSKRLEVLKLKPDFFVREMNFKEWIVFVLNCTWKVLSLHVLMISIVLFLNISGLNIENGVLMDTYIKAAFVCLFWINRAAHNDCVAQFRHFNDQISEFTGLYFTLNQLEFKEQFLGIITNNLKVYWDHKYSSRCASRKVLSFSSAYEVNEVELERDVKIKWIFYCIECIPAENWL
jgi:hypothetical protein